MAHGQVETIEVGAGRLVVARGELDLYCAGELRRALLVSVRESEAVVLDLLDVTFVDSSALGAILTGARAAVDGAGIAVACANRDIVRIFELPQIDRLAPVYGSVAEAFAGGRATPVGG